MTRIIYISLQLLIFFSAGEIYGQCNVGIIVDENLCYTDTINITNPALTSSNDFIFNGVPANVTGGTLTIYALGDLDDSFEIWDIFDEDGVNIGTIGGSGAPCSVLSITIPLSAIDLLNWSIDGTITFSGIDLSGTNINTSLCGDDYMEMVLEVCTALDCNGSDITLEAVGIGSYTTVFSEDFDSGIGGGWDLPVIGDLTNPCEPSFDGGDYLWIGAGIAGPRIITTAPMDVECGGEICFYLDYGIQNDLPPCEGIDLATEGVYLEYSTDGGSTWLPIEYYGPSGVGNNVDDGGSDPQMTTWNQYCASIPPAAFSTQTQFQWAQYGASGVDNDQWGIDNIEITRFTYCDPYAYDWAHIPGSNNPAIDNTTINATTSYIVTYSNAFESCSDTVTLTIPDGITVEAGIDTVICDGIGNIAIGGAPTASGGASGVYNYSWSPVTDLSDPTDPNPLANPIVPTMYTVLVTDGNNCSNTDSVYVGIGNSPIISVSNDTTICEGASVQLTASGGSTYLWTPPTGLNVDDNDVVIAQPIISTLYTVTGYEPSGCNSSQNVFVTVEPLPIVDGGSDVDVCDGEAVTLSASGSGGIVYSWDNGIVDGIPFIPTTTGVYTVTGTSVTGCVSIDDVLVTVNPIPVLNVSDANVCEGTSVNLDVSGASSYSWSPGTYLNQTTGASVVCTPLNDITYTVTGSSAQGCISSEDVYVSVLPTPVPLINGQVDYCTGTFSTLSTSIPYTSYTWTTGSNSATINVTEVDNPISVTVTNSYGCSGTSADFFVTESNVITYNSTIEICQGEAVLIHGNMESVAGLYSQTFVPGGACDSTSNVTLVVHPAPTVSAGADQIVCFGEGVVLAGTGAAQLDWDNGVINNQEFFPGVGSILYTLTGTDQYGCVSTDDVLVTVNDLPTVNAGSDLELCFNEPVVLAGSGALNYTWDNNVLDGIPFFPSIGSVTYEVTGTDGNGCSSTDQVTVLINGNPVVDAGSDIESCEGDYQTLSASGAASYVWDNGVTQAQPFIPLIDNNYMVVGTDLNGCSDTDYVFIDVVEIPVVTFDVDQISGCTPVNITFTNTTLGNFNDCVWSLSGGIELYGCQNVMYTFEDEGVYNVGLTLTNSSGCVGSLVQPGLITISQTPIASFYPSGYLISTLDTEVDFTNLSIGADSYSWNFGDGTPISNIYNPSHEFPSDVETSYEVFLTASSAAGCTDQMSVFISIYEELIYYVPNSFTPDGDSYNEVFQPILSSGFDRKSYLLRIYDRWGELVFETDDYTESWNGTHGKNSRKAQDGTYVWTIEIKKSNNDEHQILTGHVNLLR